MSRQAIEDALRSGGDWKVLGSLRRELTPEEQPLASRLVSTPAA
jgi:hypothetical protein